MAEPEGPGLPAPPRRAAVVGCGVIGAAWAARMVLRGVDVSVADPAPDTPATLDRILTQATMAWRELGLPTDGRGDLGRGPRRSPRPSTAPTSSRRACPSVRS